MTTHVIDRSAKALGWFSIALGVAEIFAPRWVSRTVGVRSSAARTNTLRACGVREVTAGVGILAGLRRQRAPVGWLWARVFGDVIDLALLGKSYFAKDAKRARVGCNIAAVLGVTALDVATARAA
jgi:hypothetical protein